MGRPAAARYRGHGQPLSSGSAKWNCWPPRPPRATAAGTNRPASTTSWSPSTRLRPRSDRRFLLGTGDVLLSCTNEAIHVERQGKPVEQVARRRRSRSTTRSRGGGHECSPRTATALKNFLYTPEGQRIWAEAGFRPVDPPVAEDFASDFPTPQKLWTWRTSVAGMTSIRSCSTRTTARSRRSTTGDGDPTSGDSATPTRHDPT